MIERYATPEMRELWSEAQRYRSWLEVELAAERGAQAKRLATDAAAAARDIVARLLERIEGPDLEHALTRAASDELAELAARWAPGVSFSKFRL